MADLFKQKVVLLQGDNVNGFYNNGTIFINVDSNKAKAAIFGHELGHRMQEENPEAYKTLLYGENGKGGIRKMISESAIIERLKTYGYEDSAEGRAKVMPELVNDLIGNRLTSESFWSSIAAKDKTLFQTMAGHVKKMLALVHEQMFNHGLQSDAHLEQVNKAIDVVVKKHFGLEDQKTFVKGGVEEVKVSGLKLSDTQSNYALRLPLSLKAGAEQVAREDGSTLNQFIVSAVAEKLAAPKTADYFVARAQRGDLNAALAMLSRPGGQAPGADDVLA